MLLLSFCDKLAYGMFKYWGSETHCRLFSTESDFVDSIINYLDTTYGIKEIEGSIPEVGYDLIQLRTRPTFPKIEVVLNRINLMVLNDGWEPYCTTESVVLYRKIFDD